MNVDIFTLCDNAQQYDGGKLVIVGTFNTIYAKQYPTTLPSLGLAARITFDKNEEGNHNIEYYIKKKDSDTYLLPINTIQVTVASVEENSTINLIVNGNNIQIPYQGVYDVILKIDDKEITTVLSARIKD